jgi:hypothetical protein
LTALWSQKPVSKSDSALMTEEEDGVNEVLELREDSSSSLRQNMKHRQNLNYFNEPPYYFSSALQSADRTRPEIDKERLDVERERFQTEIEERKLEPKDREQESVMQIDDRRAEREATNRLELESFKLMMSKLSQIKKKMFQMLDRI